MIAHTLLLAAVGLLRRVALRPLGLGAVHDMAALALGLLMLTLGVRLVLLVLVVPDIVPALIPPIAAIAVLRRGAPWSARRLLFWRMAVMGGRCARA